MNWIQWTYEDPLATRERLFSIIFICLTTCLSISKRSAKQESIRSIEPFSWRHSLNSFSSPITFVYLFIWEHWSSKLVKGCGDVRQWPPASNLTPKSCHLNTLRVHQWEELLKNFNKNLGYFKFEYDANRSISESLELNSVITEMDELGTIIQESWTSWCYHGLGSEDWTRPRASLCMLLSFHSKFRCNPRSDFMASEHTTYQREREVEKGWENYREVWCSRQWELLLIDESVRICKKTWVVGTPVVNSVRVH